MKYAIDLVRTQILDRRIVEANSIEEAKDKALPTFNKFDLDDYDEVEVSQLEEDEE